MLIVKSVFVYRGIHIDAGGALSEYSHRLDRALPSSLPKKIMLPPYIGGPQPTEVVWKRTWVLIRLAIERVFFVI